MPSVSDVTSYLQGKLTPTVTIASLIAAVAGIFGLPLQGDLAGSTLSSPVIAPGAVGLTKLGPDVIASIGAGGGSIAAPPRVVTAGAKAAILASDTLVCFNGPTEADLEQSPPLGTDHTIKDCRAAPTIPLVVVASGSDTIDGAQSVTFPSPAAVPSPALSLRYTPLGWRIE